MNRGVTRATVLAAALLGALAASGAAAEELKTPIRASMLLDLSAPRVQTRDTAYQESLRADSPAPVRRAFGEVQDDGSVRYGDLSVTVRNPCPPGAVHYEPAPLPGRRSK
jgi:hypothetical protein